MDTYRRRLPPARDALLVFATCTCIVQFWSTVSLLRQIPAWTLRMTAQELTGTIAYIEAFALLESLTVMAILLLACAALPPHWLRRRFVPGSVILLCLTAGLAGFAHFAWDGTHCGLALAVYVLACAAAFNELGRSARFEQFAVQLADRTLVLASLFLLVDMASVCILVVQWIA